MRRNRRNTAIKICLGIAGLSVGLGLILTAFEKNLMYFYSPSEIYQGEAPKGRPFRIGGLVVEKSIMRQPSGLGVWFTLTDLEREQLVYYEGILPDLFGEGQGIVAKGQINDTGLFEATEVLAKHDENYMPPEVADSLRK